MEDRTLLATFLVSNANDTGPGSLRQAIHDSNADTATTNTIDFNIAGFAVQAIEPLSPLPAITGPVLIDGFSQPGNSGTPPIEISGDRAGACDGLVITGPGVTVRGLDINDFSQGAGIHITCASATGDWIYGDFLGTDPTGTVAEPNDQGVEIDGGATQDLIGTNGDGVNDAAEGNVISGNLFAGVWITGQGTDGNTVAGNLIGTDVTGTVALGQQSDGIEIDSGCPGNTIGGMTSAAGNVISGSNSYAIDINASCLVVGNRIGTDAAGTAAIPNGDGGISVEGDGTTIGGSSTGAGNLISGNHGNGINIYAQCLVEGNRIGTNVSGTAALANTSGIHISISGTNATIGGSSAGAGNLVSGNRLCGIYLSVPCLVLGNSIGTDAAGIAAVPNGGAGIDVPASDATIGGTSAVAGNLISQNGGPGVVIEPDATGDQITANRIFGNHGPAIDLDNEGVIEDAPAPRQGSNNLQNFPVLGESAAGQPEGWLWGSQPDMDYRIDIFASADYGPGGAGEAEDYLGSLEVTTDSQGQVVFAVPYIPPADLPILTATATDSEGNTSEVSAMGQDSWQLPTQSVRVADGGPVAFSAASTDGIALLDPAPGPFTTTWNVTLSVPIGTLTLSGEDDLAGSGDGTGSLSYSGSLSALDAALDGMSYTPPPGFQGNAVMTLFARADGVPPVQSQLVITNGVFIVTSTADSGPGSLRQAILDSDTATGGTNTIAFDIPGPGEQTIAPLSPLPAITASVLIDGTSQPGYAGTPLIAVSGLAGGNPDSLVISGGDVSIRSLAIASVAVEATTDQLLIADVHAPGLTTELSLLDSQGNVLVESNGLSAADPDDVIDEHLAAGNYTLSVESPSGPGTYTLTTTLIPSTAPFQAIPVEENPGPIVAGDFTGNGQLDLAVAGADPATGRSEVLVIPGDGDGTFQPPIAFVVGTPPGVGPNYVPEGIEAIVAGDFTGNGQTDLAVALENGTVSVLLANGDGTFQPQDIYAVGTAPGSSPDAMVAGDFAGDGRDDLAVANSDGTASVLLSNPDGTFQPQVTYEVGSDPVAILAANFTGDGHLDLAVENHTGPFGESTGMVSILLGNGDGTFQPPVTYALGTDPVSLLAGDFAGNGRDDLAVANQDNDNPGTISVLLSNPDGTFQPGVTYAVSSEPIALVTGDFTDNDRLDLAVDDNAGIQLLLGNGDGTFQPAKTVGPGIEGPSLVVGHFTDDGHVDLADANWSAGTVSVVLGNGDGTFQPPVTYPEGSWGTTLLAAEFTDDGRDDLAVAVGENGVVSVLLSNSDGSFQQQPGTGTAVGFGTGALVAGDFTGDGRMDLAVANALNDSVTVLLSNPDGTFQPPITYALGTPPFAVGALDYDAIVAGDFNGDGRLDLAVVNNLDDAVSVLLGNGDGTFDLAGNYAVGMAPAAIVAGNFTDDGHLDLAVLDEGDPAVTVLLGNGDGTFRVQPPISLANADDSFYSLTSLVAGDFRNNGITDLAVGDQDGVQVLLGNGDGTFQPPVNYLSGLSPQAIVAGDFNGDGRLDLAVSDLDGVQLLVGNGDGTFQPAITVAAGVEGSLIAGDFTGEGHLDLAVVNQYGTISVFAGNGDGTFQAAATYATTVPAQLIVAGDFTGDGQTDLAVANESSNAISVLLNDGDGTFAAPGQLATTPHANPLVADVNGDGTDDVLVVDGAGDILYRQGIPGQPGTFEPPVTVNPGFPSLDIAWVPNTLDGPLLASVDADDDAISLYSYRNGGFVRIGSLTTGQLPAQVIAADLGGNGWDDLVVRNAGDGTLTVFFNNQFGSLLTGFDQPFSPPSTIPVGLGVSDVQAIDTGADSGLDLVVTNGLTGQVSVLYNVGDGRFAAPVPYRAGTGLSEIDPGGTPGMTGVDATAGVAGGALTPGGPASLVTINPGSGTLDVLANLGVGRFANPVSFDTASPAEVVRMGDFTGDGVDDLAVLTADGLSVYLADGHGGFLPPTTYAVPSGADGLTVADLLDNGKPDLLVGDAYGDVLVLMNNGDGAFQPYREADQVIALAVADLTGDGSKDIIYADQGLDRVVVDYGAGNSAILADQSTGLLEPGAVALADLNGDGIPDLIVTNSGSNNVLIYPGLGNGQFGPALNDGNGYFVGTNPVGITVADLTGSLPDLVIADKGSNQVSILINESEKGGPIIFSPGPRLNSGGSGPVSTVVGHFTGGPFQDLLVTNSGSNDVTLLPGVGQGFFDDQAPRVYAVGSDPSVTFVGNFNGQSDLVTVNAGSDDLTVISGFEGSDAVASTIPSGGVDPTTAFAFTAGDGFEDLVVGNSGDGALALYEGGPEGLSLVSVESEPDLPSPTALAFSALSGGTVEFYAATAGRESAALVSLSLSPPPEVGTGPGAPSPSAPPVQLVAVDDTSLPLVATVLTLTIPGPVEEFATASGEAEATGVMATAIGPGTSAGQGPFSTSRGVGARSDATETLDESVGASTATPAGLAPWERYVLGVDEALEELGREGAGGLMEPSGPTGRADSPSRPVGPAPGAMPAPRSVPERPAGTAGEGADRSSAVDGRYIHVLVIMNSCAGRPCVQALGDVDMPPAAADGPISFLIGTHDPAIVRLGDDRIRELADGTRLAPFGLAASVLAARWGALRLASRRRGADVTAVRHRRHVLI